MPNVETYHWSARTERLTKLAAEYDLQLEPKGRFFEAPGLRVHVPLVLPLPASAGEGERRPSTQEVAAQKAERSRRATSGPSAAVARYLADSPATPGRQCLILMQAGAVALGYFAADEVLATKTLKRYVVRGKGRAQPTYLAAKGKSRYGSRLRLQNARLLFEETNEKLGEYWAEFGPAEQLFVAAPTRLWPELFLAKTAPPFPRDTPTVRIPLDLDVPHTDLLLRTHKALSYGRIEWRDERAEEPSPSS